jgi:hypothetical protein
MRWAWLATLVLSSAACTASQPIDPSAYPSLDGGDPRLPAPDAGENGDLAPPPLRAPILGPVPPSTQFATVPIQGCGPIGGTVIVDSPAGGSQILTVSPRGDFCVDVPLTQNQLNAITARGVDKNGVVGPSAARDVQQLGALQPPPPTMAARNISIGGAGSSDLWFTDGDLSAMIDGDVNTSYSGRGDAFAGDYVWVQLHERSHIDHIRVRSPMSCIAKSYTLLASDQPTPATPSTSSPDWTAVPNGKIATGTGDDVIGFPALDAYHVALIFDGTDCGSVWGKHSISELEAWTVADVPPPPMVAPTCSGSESAQLCGQTH